MKAFTVLAISHVPRIAGQTLTMESFVDVDF
jgi:hypothetical protein